MLLLRPFSLVYAAIMEIRNLLFDMGWLKEEMFPLPVIGVGNLAVGGTGKTPHVEMTVRTIGKMWPKARIAVLSRGYGRHTKGFRLVRKDDKPEFCGDEPLQIKRKFAEGLTVAVCENRRRGIRLLMEQSAIDIVVLDDAFQHRYVKPSVSLVLTDYSRPYYADHVMPEGRLREGRGGSRRAAAIVVTKCPPNLQTKEASSIKHRLNPTDEQQVFFTTLRYAPLQWAATKKEDRIPKGGKVLAITGIAHPESLLQHLGEQYDVEHLAFADHHDFSPRDVKKIEQHASRATLVVTTEKDITRLMSVPGKLPDHLLQKLCVQPIAVSFLFDGEDGFRDLLNKYIPEKD
ncbi:MAG: tetraacyldisaccharide 4'-kinase [Bacteroidaceae bacterium]|nr:tetraacyldisaccharide 4'-kinase [Bacteroidaceae bacterium]